MSVLLAGGAVLLERRTLLRSLRASAGSTADYAAAALSFPVWNVIDREIEVLLKWTFREQAVTGAALRFVEGRQDVLSFRRDDGVGVVVGFPEGEKDDIVEKREIVFAGRKIASLELRFSTRPVAERIRSEALFIALVVIALDSVLGFALLFILRSSVFYPLERIERWASSLERGEIDGPDSSPKTEKGEIASLRSSIERMVSMILSKEREYRSLFESSPVSIWELDFSPMRSMLIRSLESCEMLDALPMLRDLKETRKSLRRIRVMSVNSVTLEWLGIGSLREFQGSLSSLLDEEGLRLFAEEIRALAMCAPGAGGECRITLPTGEVKSFTIRFATLAGHEGDWSRVVLTAADISDRVLMENRLLDALKQKDTLLRELFHRTRNSLQLISSMISLRETRVEIACRALLRTIRNRIDTISLAQDMLYESEDLSFLELGTYFRDLLGLLRLEQDGDGGRIQLRMDVESARVSIDYAIPLGLLLCELISNAYRHAFPDGRKGTVSVSFANRPQGPMELSVSDDGIGLPAGIDPCADGGAGFDIVFALGTQQLHGVFELGGPPGFSCLLRFSLPAERPRV